MARSKKSKSQQEQETPSSPVEEEEEEAADPELESIVDDAAPAPKKRRKRGANVQVTARGNPEEVREALDNLVPERTPAREREEKPEAGKMSDEELEQLLSDPRNKVTVVRTFPRQYRGVRCDTELDDRGYPCPVSFDEIRQDVFGRFGGKSFTAFIHPATIMGRSKVLAAIQFTNPDTDEPRFEVPQGEEVLDPRLLPTPQDGSDPTMIEEEDPMAGVERQLKTQMRVTSRQLQLAQLQKQLKEVREESKSAMGEIAAAQGDKKDGYESRLALMQLENGLNRQIDAIQNAIAKMASEPPPAPPIVLPPQQNGGGDLVKILLAQNQAAENRYTELMRQQTQLMMKMGQGGAGDLDTQLERLAKLKAAVGDGGESRVKRLENTLLDMAMERLTEGGDGEGPESDIKFAVKQLTPVIKNFVEKKITEPDSAPVPTKEQFADLAKKEAARIVQDLVRQGYLVKAGPPGLPAPHPKVGAPEAKKPAPPAPAAPAPAKPAEADDVFETHPVVKEEERAVSIPPEMDPESPSYDRKKSIDFVLDSILADIKRGMPDDSYACGDALDRLDDGILDSLLGVSTGEDLEKVVGPFATPEKMQLIKDLGKNPRVKTWLTRVITTIQDEYRRDLEAAQKEAAKP